MAESTIGRTLVVLIFFEMTEKADLLGNLEMLLRGMLYMAAIASKRLAFQDSLIKVGFVFEADFLCISYFLVLERSLVVATRKQTTPILHDWGFRYGCLRVDEICRKMSKPDEFCLQRMMLSGEEMTIYTTCLYIFFIVILVVPGYLPRLPLLIHGVATGTAKRGLGGVVLRTGIGNS